MKKREPSKCFCAFLWPFRIKCVFLQHLCDRKRSRRGNHHTKRHESNEKTIRHHIGGDALPDRGHSTGEERVGAGRQLLHLRGLPDACHQRDMVLHQHGRRAHRRHRCAPDLVAPAHQPTGLETLPEQFVQRLHHLLYRLQRQRLLAALIRQPCRQPGLPRHHLHLRGHQRQLGRLAHRRLQVRCHHAHRSVAVQARPGPSAPLYDHPLSGHPALLHPERRPEARNQRVGADHLPALRRRRHRPARHPQEVGPPLHQGMQQIAEQITHFLNHHQ